MPCYHPILAMIDQERSRACGLVKYRFPKKLKFIEDRRQHNDADVFQEIVNTPWFSEDTFTDVKGITHHNTLIPCRQCIGCRLEYSRQWANRLILELADHDPATCFFITLTYESEPLNDRGLMTLRPDDMTLFLKRLREHQSRRSDLLLRFYYSGEYGDQFHRPHYHMIVFSLDLPDLQFFQQTSSGPIFTSKYLEDIWSHGFVCIAPVAWEDCAYTARYVMKKLKGEQSKFYKQYDIVPEFSRMSRRPGIGSSSFSIENFEKGILKYVNGRPLTVPDAWKRLMQGCDLEALARVKDSKSLLTRINALEYSDATYSPIESLRSQEIELIAQRAFKINSQKV